MKKIGVCSSIFTTAQFDALKQLAAQHGYSLLCCERNAPFDKDTFTDCEVLLGAFPTEFLSEVKTLVWHQLSSAGADKVLAPYAYANDGVVITNASGAFGVSIAEYLLTGALMLLRKMPRYMENQRQRKWKSAGPIGSIYGSTVTVLGLGDLGSAFAMRVKALGATVRGVKRTRTEPPAYLDALYTIAELDQSLSGADIVACCLPYTPETDGLISRERFLAMRQGAYFLNAGRGPIVDEDALYEALRQGWLGGACIDVAREEPLPENSPLWSLDNIIITPHIAGRDYDKLNGEQIFRIYYDNLTRYLTGQPLFNIVDRSKGY